MLKNILSLLVALFAGFIIFDLGYLSLIFVRWMVFGTGEIPGGGTAVDMAFFLIPLFLAYVAGDRVFAYLRKGRSTKEPNSIQPTR